MASYVTPNSTFAESIAQPEHSGLFSQILARANGWSIFFTLLAAAVLYDQGT